MFTLKKIWDALNHAGKPWQISLAIAFGMVVGFTPLFSLHNLIIFLVVLLLNIHIGVFILSVSLFGIVGLILDPIFDIVGTSILQTDGLQDVFTSFYNTVLGNISGFNNTIVMGSLIISVLLFPFIYKFFSFVLVKYRETIAIWLKNIPLLNKLEFFKQEDNSEIKFFRLVGITICLFVVAFLSIFKLFIVDEVIKINIETSINKSTDKIIQIGSLSTNIFNSSVEIENLFISNKENNKDNVRINNIVLDIDISQLFFRKLIIENLNINEISFPNSREEIIKKENEVKQLSTKESDNPELKLDNLASLNNINVSEIKESFSLDYKQQFTKYKYYYDEIKPFFNSSKTIKEKRADGEFIYFDIETILPNVLVKKGIFSLVGDSNIIKGSFKNFTTNQYLYKKPFTLSINTQSNNFKNLIFDLSMLETKDSSYDTLKLNIKEFTIDSIKKDVITIKNTKLNTVLTLEIKDKSFLNGSQNIDIVSSDIEFKKSNKYIKMLNKSLVETKGIKTTVGISGEIKNPRLKIDSNIENILKKKIQKVINNQKDNIKNEIKKKVENKVKDKLKGILGF